MVAGSRKVSHGNSCSKYITLKTIYPNLTPGEVVNNFSLIIEKKKPKVPRIVKSVQIKYNNPML